MNGNVVLVPCDVAQRLGTFDPAYRHAIADYDYGLRAAAAGIETWIAPTFVGTCSRNGPPTAAPSREGLLAIMAAKRLPPRAWLLFTRRHTGPMWPVYWVSPYAQAVLHQGKAAWDLLSTFLRPRELGQVPGAKSAPGGNGQRRWDR